LFNCVTETLQVLALYSELDTQLCSFGDIRLHGELMSEAARLQLGLDFADDGMPPTFPIIQGKS
jgi:hypothetical protein